MGMSDYEYGKLMRQFSQEEQATFQCKAHENLEGLKERVQMQAEQIAHLTAERDEATSALSRERVEVERLREAIYKAASAPGRDWLAEQLELGRVLGDTEHKGGD